MRSGQRSACRGVGFGRQSRAPPFDQGGDEIGLEFRMTLDTEDFWRELHDEVLAVRAAGKTAGAGRQTQDLVLVGTCERSEEEQKE